jgi:hypothetical protein
MGGGRGDGAGRGGITAAANATGLERATIRAGIRELQANPTEDTRTEPAAADRVHRVRAVGGGRKPLTTEDPTLVHDLEALVEPVTRGDPMSSLRWTCKSTRQLAAELVRQGHQVSHQTVADLLHALDHSLQGTRKTREGADHPDRDAQFAYLNDQTRAFRQRGQPVISVDTKKKELVRDFHNGGREWHPAGHPEEVSVHDFLDRQLGKAIPYGGLRRGSQSRPAERRHRSRYGCLCRRQRPPLVGADGPTSLPDRDGVADHRRQRRQQRQPYSPVEDRAPAADG